jgi:ribonuclease D
VIKRYRTDLLAAIHAGLQRPAPPPVADHRRGGRLPFLSAWWAVMADQLSIAPQLLAPRELLRSVANQDTDALQGWRALALKDALTALMNGHTTLRLSPDGAVEAVPSTP